MSRGGPVYQDEPRARPNKIDDATKGAHVVSGYDLSQISGPDREKALADFTNSMGTAAADATRVAPTNIRTETSTARNGASISDKAARGRLDAIEAVQGSALSGSEKGRLAAQAAAQADYTSRADGSDTKPESNDTKQGKLLDQAQVVVHESGIRQVQRVPLRLKLSPQDQSLPSVTPLLTAEAQETPNHQPNLHSLGTELDALIASLSEQHLVAPEPTQEAVRTESYRNEQQVASRATSPSASKETGLKITKHPSGHTTVVPAQTLQAA